MRQWSITPGLATISSILVATGLFLFSGALAMGSWEVGAIGFALVAGGALIVALTEVRGRSRQAAARATKVAAASPAAEDSFYGRGGADSYGSDAYGADSYSDSYADDSYDDEAEPSTYRTSTLVEDPPGYDEDDEDFTYGYQYDDEPDRPAPTEAEPASAGAHRADDESDHDNSFRIIELDVMDPSVVRMSPEGPWAGPLPETHADDDDLWSVNTVAGRKAADDLTGVAEDRTTYAGDDGDGTGATAPSAPVDPPTTTGTTRRRPSPRPRREAPAESEPTGYAPSEPVTPEPTGYAAPEPVTSEPTGYAASEPVTSEPTGYTPAEPVTPEPTGYTPAEPETIVPEPTGYAPAGPPEPAAFAPASPWAAPEPSNVIGIDFGADVPRARTPVDSEVYDGEWLDAEDEDEVLADPAAPVAVEDPGRDDIVDAEIVNTGGRFTPGPAPAWIDEPEDDSGDLVGAVFAAAMRPTETPPPDMPQQGPFSSMAVTLFVADLARSVVFYRDTLGFEEYDASWNSRILVSGDVRIVVREVPSSRVDQRMVHVLLGVPDVDATYQALRDRGVQFVYRPRPVGRYAQMTLMAAALRDPDGHVIAITQWAPAD